MALTSGLRWELGAGLSDPWAARDAMVWGVDQPTASNTGILSTALYNPTRTSHSGTFTVPSGAQSYDSHDFHGQVIVNTSGLKYFRNCGFYGNAAPTSSQGLLTCTSGSAANIVVEDSLFQAETPDQSLDAILGHHFVARRCRVRHCVDGFGVFNTSSPTGALGVTIEMCYIADHAFFYPAAGHTDGSHCDGVQIQGGAGMVLRGNYFTGIIDTSVGDSPWSRVGEAGHRGTSCLMITPNVGAITGMTISKNWFYGGEIGSNAAKATNAGNNLGSWTSNRFGRNQYNTGHTIDIKTGAFYTASGNVYDDTGTPVTIRVYG